MTQPTIFAQIRKVDEEKRLVYGRAAEEAVDKADEIMDYMSSKPHFQKWSADIAADTLGKNLGNLRAMHGKVAAGALTAINYDDGAKAIDVVAKVVDDNEWKKVLAGVYTGFSIGGSYVGDRKVEKMDGRDVKRYTAKPTEISLVDRPCMPGAKFFEVQKADGSLAKVDFAPEPAAEDLEIRGTNEEVIAFGKLMNAEGLTMADILGKALPAFLAAKKKGAKDDTGAGKDDGADDPDADDKGDPEAKKSAAAAELKKQADAAVELEKVEAVASDAALTAVEKAFADHKDVLAKIGARNSAADKSRLAAIHDSVVGLGHECAPAAGGDAEKLAKAVAADALAKAEGDKLSKLVADAVAPLQKLVEEQSAKITKLEAQPAAPTVRLRAISKGEDMTDEPVVTKVEPVVDSTGKPNEIAGLIKSLHTSGGVSLHLPQKLRA